LPLRHTKTHICHFPGWSPVSGKGFLSLKDVCVLVGTVSRLEMGVGEGNRNEARDQGWLHGGSSRGQPCGSSDLYVPVGSGGRERGKEWWHSRVHTVIGSIPPCNVKEGNRRSKILLNTCWHEGGVRDTWKSASVALGKPFIAFLNRTTKENQWNTPLIGGDWLG